MYKIVALAAAVAVAHGGLLAAPVAHTSLAYAASPIVSSSAITSRTDGYTAVAAPVLAAAPAPVLAAAPIARAYAAPIATAYAAAPVVSSSAITSRTDSYNPIVARYAATIAAPIAAPIAHTYAAAPLTARIAAPIAYSAGYGLGGIRLL